MYDKFLKKQSMCKQTIVLLGVLPSLNDYTGGPNHYAFLINFVQKAMELV